MLDYNFVTKILLLNFYDKKFFYQEIVIVIVIVVKVTLVIVMVVIRGWRTAHAHDEQKRANSGEFRQKNKRTRICPFLPIFGQKMGKNRQKTGERNRTLAKQGETESFTEFLFGIATPWCRPEI